METKPIRRHSRLLYAVLFVTLPLLVGALIFYIFLRSTERVVTAPFETIRKVLSGIEHNVTLSIKNSITSIKAADGDELLLAELKTSESIRKTDVWFTPAGSPFVGKMAIPGTQKVSEIRVPVTFRYYIKLGEPIKVEVMQGADRCVCFVTAPTLRPLLPPAIDTSGMDFYVEAGLFRSNDDDAYKQIVAMISPELNLRAVQHIVLARDQARNAFENSIRQWLFKSELFGESGVTDIVVNFADEK